MNISTIPLGELCEILSGFAWSASKFNREKRGIPIIRIQNVDAVLNNDFVYWDESYDERFVIRKGDILLTLSGSFRIESWSGPDALLNQRIIKLTPSAAITSSWLLHVLRPRLDQIERLGKHALVNNVSIGDIRSLAIPLPPLAEQRRIAEILDRAEALRAKRRAALAKLDALPQSLFLELFGDPMASSQPWPQVQLNHFIAGFESGKSLVSDDESDSAARYRVLKVSAVTSMDFRPDQSKALPSDYEPPPPHFVRAGDLLFSRANTTELIGATAFVYHTPDNLLLPDKLWRFVWHQEPRANPHYVRFLFRQPKFKKEISQRASGTSGSMKNISQEKVLTITTALPPLPLQQEFARQVAAIEKLKASHQSALAELDALFATLQHRAFSGQL